MRLTRLRTGELIALLGALALLVSLFLDWYGIAVSVPVPDATDLRMPTLTAELGGAVADQTGWGTLGWLALVPLVVAVAGGLALAVTTLAARTPAMPLAVGVMTVPWALLAVLAVVVRLLAQPGPNAEVSVRWPAYLGLAGTVAILVGTWHALADERTDAPESIAQTERALSVRGEPRPVPPPPEDSS